MSSAFSSNQCGYNLTLEAHPTISFTVYAGTLGLVRSTSSGVFFDQNIPTFHPDIHDIAFNPKNPNEFMIASDGGMLKSTNGGLTTVNLNATLSAMECYALCSDPVEQYHVLIGTQDNGLFSRNSAPPPSNLWKALTGFDVTNVIIDPTNPARIIAQLSGSPVGITVSTTGGMFWAEGMGLPIGGDYAWIRPIISDPTNPDVYFTPYGSRIYRTTDFGFNWTGIGSSGINQKIHELAISSSSPNIMYAATGPFEYMPEATEHKLYKSTDQGITWLDIYSIPNIWTPFTLPNRYFSAIKIDRDNHDDVIITFAGFGTNHVLRTTDGGQRWKSIDCREGWPCLPDVPVNDLEIRYGAGGEREYFAATDVGVFRSSGDGAWFLMQGLPNCVVMDVEIYNSKLRVATFGRGAFEWELSSSEGKNLNNRKQIEALNPYLFTNYPNPFNPETKIKYNVTKAGYVKISVYDILGREVTVLVNGYQQQGTYEVTFNADASGRTLASGVYFYKLVSKDYTEIRKMVLAK
jgi:hypothetical protein